MNELNDVVIVGGGTSGWLSTLYFLSRNKKVTLIESEDILPIGVGEGSWPNIHKILDYANINLDDINSTKKYGINYIDWYSNQSSEYNNWYHPFNEKQAIHFEVGKLIPLLKDKCIDKINYIQDTVLDCNMNNDGYIESIILKDRIIEGQLFVDCTGFKRKLINKMNPKYINANEEIICDSAITTHIDNVNKGDRLWKMNPKWTKAIALSSGWTWEIPLQDKIGVGYVYSSKFISAEDAKKEFNNYLGIDGEFKFIKWDSGFLEKSFINNCLAIGLSSGFLEPLEATSIGTTVRQLVWLDKYLNDQIVYNSKVNYSYRHSRDYILSHYILNKRDDSEFWKHVKNLPVSKELETLFNDYQSYKLNTHISQSAIEYTSSWKYMFEGMNFLNTID